MKKCQIHAVFYSVEAGDGLIVGRTWTFYRKVTLGYYIDTLAVASRASNAEALLLWNRELLWVCGRKSSSVRSTQALKKC